MISARLEGARELEAKLRRLDNRTRNKHVRRALRAGAKVVQVKAKRTAPVRSGKLKKAIRVRAGRSKKGFFSVLVTLGKKFFTGDTFYGGFVVFGHKVGSRKLGDKRATVPPNDWLEESMDSERLAATDAFAKSLRDAVYTEVSGK